MKKILLSLVAASALAVAAAPASAQPYGGYDRGGRYDQGPGRGGYDNPDRGDRLEMRIRRAVETRQISPREANRLHDQVRATEQLSWRYRRDGAFTRWERNDIDQRYARVAQQLRYERADRDRYDDYGPYRR